MNERRKKMIAEIKNCEEGRCSKKYTSPLAILLDQVFSYGHAKTGII